MNVKRYFAKDMPEAMAMIRKELGPDAVILSSKAIRKSGIGGLFSKPMIEVMVAYENQSKTSAAKPPKESAPKVPHTPAPQKPAAADAPKVQPNSAHSVANRYLTQDGAVRAVPKAAPAASAPAAQKSAPITAITPGTASAAYAPNPGPGAAHASAIAAAMKNMPQPPVIPKVKAQHAASGVPATAAALDEAIESWSEAEMEEERSFAPLSQLSKPPAPAKQPRESGAAREMSFSAQKAELLMPAISKTQPANKGFDPSDPASLKSLDTRIVALDSLINAFSRRMQQFDRTAPSFDDSVQDLLDRMLQGEVDHNLAETLAAETHKIVKNRGAGSREVLEQLVKHTLGEPQPIVPLRYARTVVLLMGPTGVGKTTTLVKLAAHFALHENLNVGLINADTYRITAQEQLKTYADILGVPLDVIYAPDEIEAVLEKQSDRDIIFIDTPGKRPSDEKHKEEIARIIELTRPTELHLVLSASTGFRSCAEIIRNYSFVPDYRVIVTKLDETPSRGLLLNVCHYSGKRLSYLATGQNVPDDIVIASAGEITTSIIG